MPGVKRVYPEAIGAHFSRGVAKLNNRRKRRYTWARNNDETKMLTIYHNPRCSKSRAALALLQEHADARHVSITAVDYLKTPLTRAQLAQLQAMLGCPAAEMVRTNENEFGALGLEGASDEALLEALAAHPQLLQRPIVVEGDRALIARPPELLLAFLDSETAGPDA